MGKVDELLMAKLDELSDDELDVLGRMTSEEQVAFIEAQGW
jgi:hypothetical protein